ncbi:MAG: flagellar biosynthetic protein FliO, partial [Syntrophomonadaceae bacterium]|nr:flagellar biosynthetic protein FliO [Syntrophomonadaceae bacterium]
MSVRGRGQGGGRLRRIALLGLLLALAVSGLAVAAVQAAPPAASSSLEDQPLTLQYEQPAPEGGPSVIGLVFRLLVSLAVIVAMAWVIIQLFGRQLQRKAQGQWIQVLDEVVLGQNRGIVLAELGGRVYALGVTDHQVSTLFEVEDQSLIQDMMKHRPQDRGGPPPPGLAALLAR